MSNPDRPPELATAEQAQEINRLNFAIAMTAGRPSLTNELRSGDERWQLFQRGYEPEGLRSDFNDLFSEAAILGATALTYHFRVNARTDDRALTYVENPESVPHGSLISTTALGCDGRLPDGKRNRWSIVYSVLADQTQQPPYNLRRHQLSRNNNSIELGEALRRRDPDILLRLAEAAEEMMEEASAVHEENRRQEAAGFTLVTAHEANVVITVLNDVLGYIMDRNDD